jgi:SAM-dependent methyltransferase
MNVDEKTLASWPGRDRREPRKRHHAYLMLKPLREALVASRSRYVQPGARMLDVGAGVMPYFPLFADLASEYVGNDVAPRPGLTSISPIESLDQPDASFDVVLCTQVLEHVRRPQHALEEMTRVLKPGGYLLLSTHGVYPHHPDPGDYWRWTQQGFEAMFEDVAGLELVELQAHTGSAATLAMLVAGALRDLARSRYLSFVALPLLISVNALGEALDKRTPASVREKLVGNFLAVGQKVALNPTYDSTVDS